MSEILAPAGDKTSAIAAINNGADAIYLGLKEFSARSSAENFDLQNFEEIVKYAHLFGVKVYVALNTLVKDGETDSFVNAALRAWNGGADALIVSDVFLGAFLKENYPEMVLHLSTQAGVCNRYGAEFAKEKGFSRVILSRETAIEDIKIIAKIIETEVFVQGALCTCFSGQCYLSSFAGGNSGNRGKCKQPCRKLYSIDKDGYSDYSYKISLSDLCVGEDITQLLDCGVVSFKIEGRMRRPEYVAAAVKYYRNILDNRPEKEDLSNLKRVYNRGNYTKGLANGQDKNFISSAVQGHIGEYAGVVKVENGKYICLTTAQFSQGDGFKILREGKEAGGAAYGGKVKGGFVLATKSRFKNGDKVFVTTDTALNARLLSRKRLLKIEVCARFEAGKRAFITVNGKTFYGDGILQTSVNRPLDVNDVEKCFCKVDKYPFEVSFGKIETGGVFVPASELNALRRKVYSEFFDNLTQNNNVKYSNNIRLPQTIAVKNKKIAVICKDISNLNADIGILKLDDLNADISRLTAGFKGEKYLYLPPFITGAEIEKIKPVAALFDGLYCEGIYGFKLAEEFKKSLFVGCGLSISNAVDLKYCKAEYISLSKELTLKESSALAVENAFYLSCGDLKVMDLVYCLFGRKCAKCDKRAEYAMTDESGRVFTLRRYSLGVCRFEVYNCLPIAADPSLAGIIADCTLQKDPNCVVELCRNGEKLRKHFKEYTRGHSVQPIL